MSALPAAIRASIETTVRPGRSIATVDPVAGGCIHRGSRLRWDDGLEHFLKWNPAAPAGMFAAESEGLTALAGAAASIPPDLPRPRVPRPLAHGETPGGSWLVTDWAGRGRAEHGFQARFGEALALLHDVPGASDFGWPTGNWIGTLPQDNAPGASWPDFWRDRRLGPQLRRARAANLCGAEVFDRLLDRLPEALGDVGAPSLLHGDLWNGNAWAGEDGRPVIVDPAVYRGHGEVDLAMTELFGGFDADFYAAYDAVRPVDEAYESHRRDVYQLFYLLVHVNLFGSSYEAGARATAERAVRALDA